MQGLLCLFAHTSTLLPKKSLGVFLHASNTVRLTGMILST